MALVKQIGIFFLCKIISGPRTQTFWYSHQYIFLGWNFEGKQIVPCLIHTHLVLISYLSRHTCIHIYTCSRLAFSWTFLFILINGTYICLQDSRAGHKSADQHCCITTLNYLWKSNLSSNTANTFNISEILRLPTKSSNLKTMLCIDYNLILHL